MDRVDTNQNHSFVVHYLCYIYNIISEVVLSLCDIIKGENKRHETTNLKGISAFAVEILIAPNIKTENNQ